MATTYKILGQAADDPDVVQTLYTVPAATQAVVSTITVANVTTGAADFNINIVPSGGSAGYTNILAKDVALAANDTTTLTLGLTLGAGDSIVVSSDAGETCFQAFGSEIS